jgi:radical SAM superfamily enzyme with C-terminal helix-hairpin-helix motif
MAKKYRKLLAEDYNNRLVQKRFTRNLVAKIVPLGSVEELDAFIEFCNFDFEFLLNASDYEIIAAVQRKYEEYAQYQMS